MREMLPGKRQVSEGAMGERLAHLGQGRLQRLVEQGEKQWWCGACRELRTRSELEGFERDGRIIYVCLVCGELVESLPF
jgi:hypothetical protein